ncbi:MAG: DinB family protein [Bryobacteraceae bacterium]
MKRYIMNTLAAALMTACGLEAQSANAHFAEGKQIYDVVKNNLVQMADVMPEENYSFKPTPDIRTFAQMVAHVADVQARLCSTVSGQPKSLDAASKTSKTDLVAALKESSAMCDAAWDALTEATAHEMVKAGPFERSKLATLEYNSVHSNEEYGYMAVYLRLKGIVPPSTANRKK